jgi:hypothetical protein
MNLMKIQKPFSPSSTKAFKIRRSWLCCLETGFDWNFDSNSSLFSFAVLPSRAAAPAASLQPRDLTEDEALARAMSLSLQDSTPPTDPVNHPGDRAAGHNGSPLSEDEMLARAIAASEEEERRRRRERNSNQNSNQTPSQDSRANCAVS